MAAYGRNCLLDCRGQVVWSIEDVEFRMSVSAACDRFPYSGAPCEVNEHKWPVSSHLFTLFYNLLSQVLSVAITFLMIFSLY